jgi:hypothetical protein
MITKTFHISDVLSVTTGRLVSTRHMGGIYEILNWMTGDELFTHQLPRAMRQCVPLLLKSFPELSSAGDADAMAKLDELLGAQLGPKEACAQWIVWLLATRGGSSEYAVPQLLSADADDGESQRRPRGMKGIS